MSIKTRRKMSWFRYSMYDKITKKIRYYDNAKVMSDDLGWKSSSPLQDMFRGVVQKKCSKTTSRWQRYRIKKVFIPKWKTGNKYSIDKRIRCNFKKVLQDIKTI